MRICVEASQIRILQCAFCNKPIRNGEKMYQELKNHILYRGISKRKMADDLNMSYSTLLSKLRGQSHFTLDEAVAIQSYFAEDITVEELFKTESDSPQK